MGRRKKWGDKFCSNDDAVLPSHRKSSPNLVRSLKQIIQYIDMLKPDSTTSTTADKYVSASGIMIPWIPAEGYVLRVRGVATPSMLHLAT